ncbi:MAG TPA: DUF5777 family beta-barrel protein [Thermoanaerobaculia bacterium]
MKTRAGLLAIAALLAAPFTYAQDAPAPEPPRPPEGPRIVNLPSADVPAKGTLGVFFTHRFSQPLADADFHSFFGFDSSASIGLGVSYAPLDGLDLSLDRSSSEDDYELAAKYRVLPMAERRPFALSVRIGGNVRSERTVEGDRYAFFAQGIASVSIGRRVRVTAIPTWVSNTALFKNVFNVPVAISVGISRTVNVQAELYPKNQDFTERPGRKTSAGWIVALEKTVLRHRFAFTAGNLRATSVDQYTASDFGGGIPRKDVYIGFNLVRQWKLK